MYLDRHTVYDLFVLLSWAPQMLGFVCEREELKDERKQFKMNKRTKIITTAIITHNCYEMLS